MTVADRIKLERQAQGLTQDELAKKMGYSSKSAVSRTENAGDSIGQKRIREFANALGVSEMYLMGWSDNAEQLSTPMIQGQRAGRLLASISKKLLDNDVDYIIKLMELSPDQKEIVFNQIDFLHMKKLDNR